MRILNHLCDDCIDTEFEAVSKQDALEKLARKAVSVVGKIDIQDVYRVLSEREDLGSTAIGNGVAIPHGKIPGLDEVKVIVLRSRHGIPFDSLDGEPVYVIFLLLAPDDATNLYLKVLARVSRILKLNETTRRIREAKDREEIRRIIGGADNIP